MVCDNSESKLRQGLPGIASHVNLTPNTKQSTNVPYSTSPNPTTFSTILKDKNFSKIPMKTPVETSNLPVNKSETSIYATVRDMGDLLSDFLSSESQKSLSIHSNPKHKLDVEPCNDRESLLTLTNIPTEPTDPATDEVEAEISRKDSGYVSNFRSSNCQKVCNFVEIDDLFEPLSISTNLSLTTNVDSVKSEPISQLQKESTALAHLNKSYEKKLGLLKELLETEVNYVNDLRLLVDKCFDRLNAVSWLPLEDKCLLIRNAADLLKVQTEFLDKMQAVLGDASLEGDLDSVEIGSVFIEFEERFDVYNQYCTQHDGALSILSQIEKKPEMVSILTEFKGFNQSKLDVRDYLIKPVQRICKYPLFLNELIKLTNENSRTMRDLLQAHSIMQTVASNIDSAKWYLDNLQRTDKFFARLDSTGHAVPSRMETGEILLGNILLIQNPDGISPRFAFRAVFLFAEFLFIVKIKKSNCYLLRKCISLNDCEICFESNVNVPHAWSIHVCSSNEVYVFGSPSERERKVWKDILECIVQLETQRKRDHCLKLGVLRNGRRKSVCFGDCFKPLEPSTHHSKPWVTADSPLELSLLDSPAYSPITYSPVDNDLGEASSDLLKRTTSYRCMKLLKKTQETPESLPKIVESLSSTLTCVAESPVDLTWKRPESEQRKPVHSFILNSPSKSSSYHTTHPHAKKSNFDSRISDVTTPNIENLKFTIVAGLIVPNTTKAVISSTTTLSSIGAASVNSTSRTPLTLFTNYNDYEPLDSLKHSRLSRPKSLRYLGRVKTTQVSIPEEAAGTMSGEAVGTLYETVQTFAHETDSASNYIDKPLPSKPFSYKKSQLFKRNSADIATAIFNTLKRTLNITPKVALATPKVALDNKNFKTSRLSVFSVFKKK